MHVVVVLVRVRRLRDRLDAVVILLEADAAALLRGRAVDRV